jgi:hypothetical protein
MAVPMHKPAPRWAAPALFLINALIVRELFFIEYTREMGSIEAAYISISRYITENWSDLTWFPLWYGGIPFQNTYPPLLHIAVAAAADVFNWSAARAHHFVTAVAYCLGPVTLYSMALRISGDRIGSFLSGLVYSLLSTSAVLIPVVAHDTGGVFYARRLQALVHYGEGPHVTSMTLLPVAILCLHLYFERRRPLDCVLAAASFAAVVLTNWLGGFALAAAVVSYLLARRAGRKDWACSVGIGIFAYTLAAPWIPPTTLLAIRENAQRIGGPYQLGSEHLFYAGVFTLLLVVVHVLLLRMRVSRILHFSILFFLFMGVVTLAAQWFKLYLLPQPERYHLEMEIAIALLAVFLLRQLFSGKSRAVHAGALAFAVLFTVFQFREYRWYAKQILKSIDVTQTIEYKVARWFDQHMQSKRVMAPGSISFWMNAFTDTPQIGGGFDQGIINQQLPVMQFQVYSGMAAGTAEGEIAITWLKALGVHAVAIGGKHSGEYYKPFNNPSKFEGLLPELWSDGDDRIYSIPHRSASTAHVMRPEHLVQRVPEPATDIAPLKPYVAALADPSFPHAEWTWHDRHSATASARLRRGQVLSVQIAYHPGWNASVNGKSARVTSDGIGQIVVEPDCEGECQVDLVFTGGTEAAIARVASYGAILAALVWIAASPRRKRGP